MPGTNTQVRAKSCLINAITTSRFSQIAKIPVGTGGFTGYPHYCTAFLSTCTYRLRRNFADRPHDTHQNACHHAPTQNCHQPPIITRLAAMAAPFLPPKPSIMAPSPSPSSWGGNFKPSDIITTTSLVIYVSAVRRGIEKSSILASTSH